MMSAAASCLSWSVDGVIVAAMDQGHTSAMARPTRRLLTVDNSLRARLSRSASWKARKATASRRALPDFVVIGGQRCGTTSLFESLSQHHDIEPSFSKEVHYFDLFHERGLDWYRAHFPLASRMSGSVCFEATPNYLSSVHAPGLMHAVMPDTKMIVLMRDPVERTHSSWKLRVYEGSDDRPFVKAVEEELAGVTVTYEDVLDDRRQHMARAMRWSYVEKSRYAEHLTRWFEVFDRDQFLILESEALFANPADGLASIEAFVGIDHDPTVTLPRSNFTAASSIDPPVRQYLTEYFAPHNERLTELTGLTFTWT